MYRCTLIPYIMEKYQLYRTALDALQFLITQDLLLAEVDVNALRFIAGKICENIADLISVKRD